MPKILIEKLCLVLILVSSAVSSSAQCYTKELITGIETLKGTSEYIYVRGENNYLGMTFTLKKESNSAYSFEIMIDETPGTAKTDSIMIHMESSSSITISLPSSISTTIDGDLRRSVVQVNVSPSGLESLRNGKVTSVTAYSGASKISVPVYDERFLRQQFECLK